MKVFLNKPIPEVGYELLKKSGLEIITPASEVLSREQWLNYCTQSDIVLNVSHNAFDKEFFEKCRKVKAISLFSVGFDHVDIAIASKCGVRIGNTPDVLSNATADTAFLLMQSVARRAAFNFERVKNGSWGSFDASGFLGQELTGKVLGIYGLGRIGFEMAKKSKQAFEMEIIYHNRNRNPEAEEKLGARYVSFEELVKESDVLSVHASFSHEKSNLFNAAVFEEMKRNSIFINTARGGFHDEEALYNALVNKKVWGAGLDVTNPEPMNSASPLLELSTVCVFPHIGSATVEARNGMAIRAVENVIAFAKGDKMPYAVN